MAYEPQTWADGEEGGTPLNAERLNHIEQGVAGAAVEGHSHSAADVNSGTFAAARIPNLAQSKVTGLADLLDGLRTDVDQALDDSSSAEQTGLMVRSGLDDLVSRVEALEAAAAPEGE